MATDTKTLTEPVLFGLETTTTYSTNVSRVRDGQEPCARCGKGCSVNDDTKQFWWVHCDGGYGLFPADFEVTDEVARRLGDRNWFPLGSDCARYVPAEYRTRW